MAHRDGRGRPVGVLDNQVSAGLNAEIERLRAQDREVRRVLRATLVGHCEDAATTAQLARSAAGLLMATRIRADRAETEVNELRVSRDAARAQVAELRASGRETLLETTRRGLREFGTPPPGEGGHPLQGHRDSMG